MTLDHCYTGTENIVFPEHDQRTPVMSPVIKSCEYTVDDMQNEHMYSKNENLIKKVDSPKDLKSVLDVMSREMDKLKRERDYFCIELKKAQQSLLAVEKTRDEINEIRRFGVHMLEKNESLVKIYTGLPSMALFNYVFDKVSPNLSRLNYYRGESAGEGGEKRCDPSHLRPGPDRELSHKDEMLMTLMKLRLNLTEDDLAVRFDVSRTLISSILTTWICLLAKELEGLIHWPEPSNLLNCYPECFKKFGTVLAIIDCFEIPIQRASLAKANAQTFSSYKDRTTAKVLVACTPCGSISLLSTGWGGSISDKDIVCQSELLDKIEASAFSSDTRLTVLADKGFNIQELLLPYGVRLEIPPFLKNKGQLSEIDNKTTKIIANARIHVERVIGRIKEFQILKSELQIQFADLLDNILIICAAIVNLQAPVVKL